MEPVIEYTQADRKYLMRDFHARTFRKKSRILAVKVFVDFTVETDRGPMTGKPGDWLVTNHPDDDPDSGLWTISDERMKATYAQVDESSDEPDSDCPTNEEVADEVVKVFRILAAALHSTPGVSFNYDPVALMAVAASL